MLHRKFLLHKKRVLSILDGFQLHGQKMLRGLLICNHIVDNIKSRNRESLQPTMDQISDSLDLKRKIFSSLSYAQSVFNTYSSIEELIKRIIIIPICKTDL